MHNVNKPDASELPSTGQLLGSTGIAAVVAGALLVTAVLPAEYGVDPTGAGSLFGLTEMGRIKMALAKEAEAEAAVERPTAVTDRGPASAPAAPPEAPVVSSEPAKPDVAATPTPAPEQQAQTAVAVNEATLTLAPDEAIEIKLVMEKGAKATYLWFTDGPGVNYDTHGDGPGIKYHGYGKGTNTPRMEGELTAAFAGSHGWFWRNRSGKDVKITLRTSGEYSDVKQID